MGKSRPLRKKLASGDRVDPLQLPKLEKKAETIGEVQKLEEVVNASLQEEAMAKRKKHIEQERIRIEEEKEARRQRIEAEKAEKKRLEEERRAAEAERLRQEEEEHKKRREEEQRLAVER